MRIENRLSCKNQSPQNTDSKFLENFRIVFRRFLKEEEGQSTVEYVLFMAVLVAVILAVGRGVKDRIIALASRNILPALTNGFFPADQSSREGMYHYRI